MQNPDSELVARRFFEALRLLKTRRIIRGRKTFTDRYGINRWNMNTCEKEPHRDIFQLSWLTYLVRDYGVSPRWLLLGEGEPLPEPCTPTVEARASHVGDTTPLVGSTASSISSGEALTSVRASPSVSGVSSPCGGSVPTSSPTFPDPSESVKTD